MLQILAGGKRKVVLMYLINWSHREYSVKLIVIVFFFDKAAKLFNNSRSFLIYSRTLQSWKEGRESRCLQLGP